MSEHFDPLLSQAETLGGTGADRPAPGPRAAAVGAPPFPVQGWDRYEFLGFLGQGGMGMVFRARDRRLGREVAIKFVRSDDERFLQRFMVEARAQARVEHEHVCKVFEVGEVEGRVFIAMQHLAGTSLDQATDLTLEQKVIVLRDAALGVHAAHMVGIIHRDLKPSNLMVERAEDGACRTYVMDFGLAREWNQEVTETGSVLGTPLYMSPEQARGEVSSLDRRTDIYSLGATLYHALSGRPPLAGANPLEVLSAIATSDIPSMRLGNPDLPRDLDAIVLKCLEKERSRRYASARAFAEDLERFLAGDPVLARPTGLLYRLQRRLRKHKQLALVGAAALTVVLVALGMALKTRRDAGRREQLAQQFAESMGRIEGLARYSALSPQHDIRPDLESVREEMTRVEQAMAAAGALANGPGNYALGRGHLTLDDSEKAIEHLQLAWDAGFRAPRVAYALGDVLGRSLQDQRLEAERIADPARRRARLEDLEATLRVRVLSFLRQARGSDAPAPAYLEALMASYEGRTDEAITRLDALEHQLPWFYEAPLLRGQLLQSRGWNFWNRGNPKAAEADFEAGRRALAAAALSGRSAPVVYAAQARLEEDAFYLEKWSQGHVMAAYERGLQAVDTALRVQADHVPSLILKAGLLDARADFTLGRGEQADALVEQAVRIARQALAAGPARVDAWRALGKAYYQWGSARLNQNQDPTEPFTLGLSAFESISPEKRDYQVENHLGLIHQLWSDFEDQRGRDPQAHLNGAIAAYGRATRMEPYQLPAWINLATCLQQRAAAPRANQPETDLQGALEALDQAQHLNPRHFVPYFVRGKVLLQRALIARARGADPGPDLRRSVEANRQGLAINPRIPNLHNGLGMALLELAQGAWDGGGDPGPASAQAAAAFRQAMTVAPRQVFGYLNLGDLLIRKARWEQHRVAGAALTEAGAVLRKGLQVAPGDLATLKNLGRIEAVRLESSLGAGGDPTRHWRQGEALFQRVLSQDAGNAIAWNYLGELRSAFARWQGRQGQATQASFERARQAFAKALDTTPEDPETLLNLARLGVHQAEWEQARGRNPAPQLAHALMTLAKILKQRPDWGQALALQGELFRQEAMTLDPSSRVQKARQARSAFEEAFRINRNLQGEWQGALAEVRSLSAPTAPSR